jgi:anti-anti-sigma regulatory factor
MNMRSTMSARITVAQDPSAIRLVVSGRLVGPWITELARAFELQADRGAALVVDISDVSFVSSDGVAMLRGLLRRGASVHGCPTYLEPQLRGEP